MSSPPLDDMGDNSLDFHFADNDATIDDEQRQQILSFVTQIDNNPAIRYDVTGYYEGDTSKDIANQRANAVVDSITVNEAMEAGLGLQNFRIHLLQKTDDEQADVNMTCC